jgi:AcrR family transcriptional regulator
MRQKDETKAQDILRATLDEVQVAGLAGLSMEAVARRAGVATGTVYTYFKSKEALLDSLYRHAKLKFAAFVAPVESAALRPAFVGCVKAYLDYVIDHQSELVFMGQMANSPYLSDETRAAGLEGVRPLMRLLDRGKAEQLLKDIDTAWMTTFLWETLKGMAIQGAKLPRDRYPAFQDTVAAMCWDALKT